MRARLRDHGNAMDGTTEHSSQFADVKTSKNITINGSFNNRFRHKISRLRLLRHPNEVPKKMAFSNDMRGSLRR